MVALLADGNVVWGVIFTNFRFTSNCLVCFCFLGIPTVPLVKTTVVFGTFVTALTPRANTFGMMKLYVLYSVSVERSSVAMSVACLGRYT